VRSIPASVAGQLERRLQSHGEQHAGAKPEAAALLAFFRDLYDRHGSAYFHAMDRLLETRGDDPRNARLATDRAEHRSLPAAATASYDVTKRLHGNDLQPRLAA
jgi:hypothetical protein